MYEVEIEYPDGTRDTFNSFTVDFLMDAVRMGHIESFKIYLRRQKIVPNPLKKQPK